MMTNEQLSGIVIKENKDFFRMFSSVDKYMVYRAHASNIVKIVCDIMNSPQALVQVSEAISKDKPYLLTYVNQKFVTSVGASLNEYARNATELALETAHEISSGAICWEKMEEDDADYYFMWVEPEDIVEKWTHLVATMEKIGMHINKKAEEENPEIPDYDEHFAETPTPDLSMN